MEDPIQLKFTTEFSALEEVKEAQEFAVDYFLKNHKARQPAPMHYTKTDFEGALRGIDPNTGEEPPLSDLEQYLKSLR